MKYTSMRMTSWEEIHEHARTLAPGWIFRGQRAADLNLKTSLERSCDRYGVASGHRHELEDRLFREFRRTYHHYASHVPDRSSVVEWLSLMQHHGAPTRLLDFTYSIYVAAYFATEANDRDSAIWALDGPWALGRSASLLGAAGKHEEDVARLFDPFTEGSEEVIGRLFFDMPYVCAAWPINPFRLNQRLRIQQGVFLIPGEVAEPFMANLEALLVGPDSVNKILKIVIPVEIGRVAARRLFAMGISRTSLFPGLDGYARSLQVWHPAYDPIIWKPTV